MILEDQEMAFTPLKPLRKPEKEPKPLQSLEELALLAVVSPGEIARHVFPTWHAVRMALEQREFSEMRERYRKEHAKKFRYVMKELKYVMITIGHGVCFPATCCCFYKQPVLEPICFVL